MASTLDKLRQLANQNYTQEQAQQVINQNYDFDSWRQEDASLITPEYRSIIEENRRRYEQNVAPALEYNRQREAFLREYGMYPEEYERQQRQTPSGISKEDLTPAQMAIDRILGVDRTQVTGEDTNWLDVLKGSWSKGINQWNALNWKTADFLLGGVAEEIHALGTETVNGLIDSLNMIPGVNIKNIGESKNFISRMNEDAQRGLQNATDKYTANANSSRAAQIADQFGTSLVAAIPLALEAFLLGPTQAAAAASSGMSTAGLTYFSGLQSATGATAVGMMAKEGLTKLVRNPQFWTSYLQVAGDGYESALEDGMNEEEAAVYGLVNGFVNSIIEIGGADETLGGIQNLPMRLEQMRAQGGKKAVVEWFKDAVLGEGKEEVLQGMFERGSKSFFGEDVPIASLDPNDQRAIFNPYTAGQEFTGGAVVGLGLGGGQVAADRAIRGGTNAVATAIENRQQTQAQQRQETEATFLAQVVRELDVSKAASQVLVEGYGLGDADAQSYARGIQEAVKLGEMGIPYAQAREESVFGQKLNDTQFQHAWQIGQQKSGRAAEEEAPQRAVTEYGSIEDFSREFKSPEKVTEIYDEAADTDVNEFAAGFRAAYDMGQSGVSANYLTEENIPALTETQRTAAFELGRTDAESTAVDRDLRTVQRQKPGNLSRVKGTVRGEGVTIADMKKAFNDSQNTAYRLLTRYAETTGVNIVLYNSQADTETGLFPDAQGRFQWKDDTIYIDINSGLNSINDVNSLGKYTMLRTFGHEFTHFIEKWNATEYNSFREMVFSTLEAKGENVHDLIEAMQARDASGKMTYEQASREVIADGMMDILQDSTLVQQLAEEQPNVFKTLLKKLREFAARMKQYYREISTKAPREAQALKENNAYLENIVKMWDQIAKGAVQNYQGAYGETLFDQPAKPANLPKRQVTSKLGNTSNQAASAPVAAAAEQSESSKTTGTKRAGMDFFRPVDVTEEEAPKLSRMAAKNNRPASMDFFRAVEESEEEAPDLKAMAAQRNRPVSRDRFPANDLTSQAEQGPDLKNMVPRAQEETKPAAEQQQEAEAAPETPAATAERLFGKKLARNLEKSGRVGVFYRGNDLYISWTGMELIPISKEAADFAQRAKADGGYGARLIEVRGSVTGMLTADYTRVTEAPVEVKYNSGNTYYLFTAGDRTSHANKAAFDYFDGGKVYIGFFRSNGVDMSALKILNKDGTLAGYIFAPPANERGRASSTPTKLKSFSKSALSEAQKEAEAQAAPEEPETPAAAVETQEAVPEAAEAPAREESPAATTLRNRLSGSDSVDFNGFRYEIFGMRSTTANLRNGSAATGTEYRGTIRRVSTGGVPVADGRTVFDRTFDDREEAVDYMVSVAENNHLLEEAPSSGKPDGNAQTRKTGNDNARLAEGSEGVRGGSSGRETAASPSEVAPAEGSVPERGDSGAGRVPASTPDDRGSASGRNGRNDRNGDGGRLQSGSNASGSGRKNGAAPAGVQGTVPLKSPSKQNARNYHIEEDIDSIRPNIQDNIAAIKLVKKLIAENRPATDEERAVLAKYKGWGGLKNYILDRQGYWARQIQQLLTPEEYETARDSVLNAHYTSTKVIAGIYKAVQRMGFKGGNILEPSMGVGNFFGMLPKNLSSKSSLYGVELDKITGTIAKNLYPDARIDVAGFQDILYGDGTFDLVVGNVPFSNDIKIPYRGTKFNLHDFFFVKALDETRPGGVLALITSTGTLDKLSGKTQTAIAERANLIAAFRLPDNAFLSNAGTSVTTDLIFLQRKGPGVEDNGIRFTEIGKIDGVPINEYYVEHPENVLGELAYESGMYASERTVVHATRDFEARFNKAMESLPKNLMTGETKPNGSVSVQKRGERKRTTFRVTDKGVSLVDTDGNETKLTGKPADVAKKYVEIKQLYFATYEAEQNGNIEAANQYREKLNKSYDAFTKKYGTLEKNKKALGKDDEFLRVSGLEIVDKEGNVYKSAIFERPTLYRERKTSADTSSEGLSIVLNETGRVDVGMIADLTGKTEEEVVEDLKDEIIFTPDGIYELMPKYLSGNIYQKLEAVEEREGFERQTELLRSVLPKPKTARDIDAEISSHWIPPKYISQFVKEVFQPYGTPSAKYVKELGKWDMEKFWSPIRKWSTGRVDAFDLLLNTLNNKHIVVNDTDEDGKKVFNKRETEIAQSKQNDLRSAFREWIFKDEERRADLEDIFNRTLNAYAPMNFNALADKIDFGIDPSSKIKLRDYQKAAVARIVFGGNTLLHHGVGTGKTATMITAAHVLKSTGVSKKPMFVVPNGKVLDFKREILGMYPGARILALDADLLSPRELKRTKALIATNDWDYVLIHKSGFQKIGVSPETTAAFIEQQIEELETAIRESNADAKRGTRFEKNLITKKKNLEEKLKKILESPKDESTTFENMGIDALFVDEAHNFKKVGFATTQEISGVDSSTNGLTTDLYMKENWLRDRGGRIVLATATPITNTVSEMYNMTLHVNPDILREAGVYAFDGWLNTFGDMRSEMEIASDGKTFRMKERIQDFKNANELISLYRQFADVKQTKDVVKDLPKAEDVTVICSGNEIHRRLLDNFAARMEKVGRGNKDDNALNVNNDAKAAATDLRMVSSLIQELFPGTSVEELDLPDSKINKCVGYIVDEYRKSMKNKGTQLVFLDSGMGRGNTKRYTFNLYGDLISKLVKNGIPREQIADIGDYDGDAAKQKLYDLVNDGTIRVLIGSTAKMGEGVNVQNKIVAIHHLSVPMRADNLEQRDGRGIRHGNENKEVRIYKYIQEPSYDSYLWQMIERKSKYMAQALNGGDASDLEEISNVMVNAKQSKALATGNPAIMEKFKLEDEIATLRTLENAYNEETREAAHTAAVTKREIENYETRLELLERDQRILEKNQKDDFELTVGKKTYDKRTDAATALFSAFIKDNAGPLGSIYGLKISKFTRDRFGKPEAGIVFNDNPYTFVSFGDSPEGNITRLVNGLGRIGETIEEYNKAVSSLQKTVADAEKTAARSEFPRTQELSEKLARLTEINRELGINTGEVEINVTSTEGSETGDDNVEYSLRQTPEETEEAEESAAAETIVQYSRRVTEEEEIEYATRRAPGLSNREVLSMAADELDRDSLSEAERNALQIFRDNLTRLEEEQDNRKRLGREYKDQQFTKGGSRQEADRIRAAMSVSDSKIKALENRLLSLENKDVLKSVLQKARRVVETEERKRGDENLKRYRERRNESMATRKYREHVRREVETLREWLMRPSNKDQRAHVPAEIQKTVADFLESINLMSPTALRSSGLDITKADERYLKNMKKMRDAIKHNVDSQGLYSGYADLPQDFIETFEALIAKTEQHISSNSGEFVVNQMTAAELKDLHQTLKTLRKFITTMNMFHNNAMFRHAYDAGEDTIQHLTSLGKSKKSGTIYKFLRFDYMRPSYAFEHFGKGGQSIEHEFREGQATQAFLANKIIDFAKKTYTAKEVKAWSEETKSFETSDGETVTMPITHLMSLYCLNKRPQALTHIYGDGIRVANYKDGKVTQLDEGHIVTIDDVQKMIQELTPRQREVADALQKYMSTETAIWGNYVSMKRFDVEQFTEENYFPINSDGRYLATTADESPETAGLYALLNSSFTKELKENADNRIILYNIFDVFANHTASMTQYRSFALPVLDALKWFNYKNDTTSVRTKLSSAFGAPLDERAGSGAKGYAEQFVINLLKAYNATAAQGDPYDTIALRFLHRYNGAAIAYNLRVIIQQPTAIARAAMILSPAKLAKGLGMSVMQLRNLASEMEQHSGIAAWKALGFYDTNISRGLTDLIKQNPGVLDRVMEVGTKGAEAADRLTWAAMWYAAKDSVKRSDYATEDEYFKAVTELFEDVIYKTQVVDSLLTKAEFLRSKGAIARQMGSFMSEPSATMSMLSDAYYKYTDDLQRGMSRSEAWKKNGGNIAKTAAVYAVGQVLLSAMQAVIDAWRDNDDKDPDSWIRNYLMKYLDSFKGNVVDELLPFGKVPIVSELYEVLKGKLDDLGVFDKLGLDLYGNDISSGLSMYLKYLEKAWDVISDKIQGKSTNYTNYSIIYNLMRGVSNLTGIPLGTAWREVQDVWNNTVGFLAPDKKLITYQRAADKAYATYIKNTGLSQKDYQAILDDADKVFGDNSGTYKQDEVGAALVAALEDGKITEEQAAAIWRSKWHKENNKTFDDWRSGGKKTSPAASTMTKPSPANNSPAPMRPAAGAAAASTGNVSSYEDFKKVIPVYGTADKEALYNVWNSVLTLSGMSLDRFTEILANADTDGNKSIKQAEMGEALYAAMQRGELSFEQCDAVWRSLWNKARSKTFAKWLNG